MAGSRSGLQLGYRLQALGARLIFAFFGLLPLDAASALGGSLARRLGPLTRAHRTAVANLRRALPYKNPGEMRLLISGMWDNIGRTVAEYPHLAKLMNDQSRIEIIDKSNVVEQLRDDGIGALLVAMHSGNWELTTVPGFRAGMKQHHFFRAPNNPFVDRLIAKMRAGMQQEGYLPKGAMGARQAAGLLKNHAHISMLVDQKQDEGIPVKFFNRDAMTTTAPAAFARHYNVPIGAGRVVRLSGARFRIYVEPVEVVRSDDREADIAATTRNISSLMENWIRQYPEQWLWVHRRWPKDG